MYISILISYFYLFILISGNQIIINNNIVENKKLKRNNLPEGFIPLNEKILDGPITTNREKDDGRKRNLYSMIRKEDDSFYYDYNGFNKLENETSVQSVYFCELHSKFRPEVLNGQEISCPKHYTIVIDKAFYGRYANDIKHCLKSEDKKGILREKKKLKKKTKKECGYEPINRIKSMCEQKRYCKILPMLHFYKDYCWNNFKWNFFRYLHINYHCVKDKELKKERISIISFYDGIKSNSLQEHSVSELYQYANIHGYEFEFSSYNYIPESVIFFMKIQTIIQKLIEGLKYKKYDWIFWADNDTLIPNPNIKLESFLPNERMYKTHLIAAFDALQWKGYDGLNAGVLLIRVHEWSLKLLMRVMTYPYYNKEKYIINDDQTSLNNILLEFDESNHYVIVPPSWFNSLYIKKGDFFYHAMGGNKKTNLNNFLNYTKDNKEWYSRTNKEMRKEVLDYYNLNKDEQIQISIQP